MELEDGDTLQVMRACNDEKKMYKEKGHLILL